LRDWPFPSADLLDVGVQQNTTTLGRKIIEILDAVTVWRPEIPEFESFVPDSGTEIAWQAHPHQKVSSAEGSGTARITARLSITCVEFPDRWCSAKVEIANAVALVVKT
jgi:hypothetical protein